MLMPPTIHCFKRTTRRTGTCTLNVDTRDHSTVNPWSTSDYERLYDQTNKMTNGYTVNSV